MSKTTTVSAKVPEHLKDRAQELGINISSLTRKALKRKVEEEERKVLRGKAERAGKILKEVSREDIVKAVRETRESA